MFLNEQTGLPDETSLFTVCRDKLLVQSNNPNILKTKKIRQTNDRPSVVAGTGLPDETSLFSVCRDKLLVQSNNPNILKTKKIRQTNDRPSVVAGTGLEPVTFGL